ncbi:MAG TPA: sigma-70 family RNA polymerase sigma factor [Polyangia bacterium]|nr:sigma-70 family RNA polymerase sigma factor [Polyangia bacterium]
MGAPGETDSAAVEHLFRREAGRMSAVVLRLLGFGHLDLAEDIVHDALVQALEVWKYGGLPDNPAAWLMAAAKNRAIDVIRRERTARRFAPELADQLSTEWSLAPTVAAAFEDREIVDAELRLMFELADGRLPEETQVMLILKYLCGFGVREIAQAFLSGEDAVEKRLSRARATLQAAGGWAPLADAQRVRARAPAVCRALYLLFNEGYHGSHPEAVVREELCGEALRLGALLADHPVTGVAEVKGLFALMCLLGARLPARRDARGDLVPLDEQDRARWDAALGARGLAALGAATAAGAVGELQLEAAIAAQHAVAPSVAATDWTAIVALYDRLAALRPSPVVALNRAVAVGFARGLEAGLAEIEAIERLGRLDDYLFLAAARGDLLRRAGRRAEALPHYRRARELARNEPERRFFARRLAECGAG